MNSIRMRADLPKFSSYLIFLPILEAHFINFCTSTNFLPTPFIALNWFILPAEGINRSIIAEANEP